jgi:hypothetical protein
MHHRLQSSPDREEPGQAQQVQCCSAKRGHHAGAIAPIAVGILMELRVSNPVPALDAPAVSHQLQQGFWGGAQAGEKHVAGAKGLAVTRTAGHVFHDPAGADPGLIDVLWSLFGGLQVMSRPGPTS